MSFAFAMTEVAELLNEAAEARSLAAEIKDPASVRDLLQYAAALEAEAASLQGSQAKESSDQPSVARLLGAVYNPGRTLNPGRRAS
jgi:hypothetical protein